MGGCMRDRSQWTDSQVLLHDECNKFASNPFFSAHFIIGCKAFSTEAITKIFSGQMLSREIFIQQYQTFNGDYFLIFFRATHCAKQGKQATQGFSPKLEWFWSRVILKGIWYSWNPWQSIELQGVISICVGSQCYSQLVTDRVLMFCLIECFWSDLKCMRSCSWSPWRR